MAFWLNNKGDTIVEVLIVLAVIAVVIAGAYSASILSLQESRQTEEHSEALNNAQSQIELLKLNFQNNNPSSSNPSSIFSSNIQDSTGKFCMNTDGSFVYPSNNCNYTPGGVTYLTNITRTQNPPGTGNYVFMVSETWNSIRRGTDQVSIAYKLDTP